MRNVATAIAWMLILLCLLGCRSTPNANSDVPSDLIGGSDLDENTSDNTDGNSDTHSDGDADADGDADVDGDTAIDTDTHSDTDSDGNTDTDSNGDNDGDNDTASDNDGDADSDMDTSTDSVDSDTDTGNESIFCPPMPSPEGNITSVSTVKELYNAIDTGYGTISMEPGTYHITETLLVEAADFRGATGNPDDVILDFSDAPAGHVGILISRPEATFSGFTIQNLSAPAVDSAGTIEVVLYNLRIKNAPTGVIYRMADNDGGNGRCVIACTRIECSPHCPENLHHFPYEEGPFGIHADYSYEMNFRDNHISGIRGAENNTGTAIYLKGTTSTMSVERNVISDFNTAIYMDEHASDNRFLNNFFTNKNDYQTVFNPAAVDALIAHNTAYLTGTQQTDKDMVTFFKQDPAGEFVNNLSNVPFAPAPITSKTMQENNVTNAQANWFVNPDNGNLHLTEAAADAIDKAAPLETVPHDIDGDERPKGEAADMGADEF